MSSQGACSRCGREIDLDSTEADAWAVIPSPLEGELARLHIGQTTVAEAFVCPECLTDDERVMARRLSEFGEDE